MKLEITFDNGQVGQRLMKKLEAKYGKPDTLNNDEATWSEPSRELIEAIVTQILEDDIVLDMTITKD